MSQAPRHSKPLTKNSPSAELAPPWPASWGSAPVASQNASSSSSAPFIQQEMLVQTSTRWRPTGCGGEEVVEARDRLAGRRGSRPSPRPPGGSPRASTSRSGAGPPTAPGSRPSAAAGSCAIAVSICSRSSAGTSTSCSSGTPSASSGRIEAISSRRSAAVSSSVGRSRCSGCAGAAGARSPVDPPEDRVEHRRGSRSGRRCSRRRTCRAAPAG